MLDAFGKIAAAEIVFYIPILGVAFFVAVRHGFGRKEGWIFLFTFSLVRVLGAILSIVSKNESNPSSGLLMAVAILQGLGLSPLLLATLGFVSNIARYGLPGLTTFLRLTRLALSVGLILAIIGGTKLSPDNPTSTQNTGHTLSKVGVICFMGAYGALVGMNVLLWGARQDIPKHHRTLLSGVSLTLPFLALRILYSLMSAFKPNSRWSSTSTNGDWKIYLGMGVIMEYIVVCIYVFTGSLTPLHKDEEAQEDSRGHAVPQPTNRGFHDRLLEMGAKKYAPSPYQ